MSCIPAANESREGVRETEESRDKTAVRDVDVDGSDIGSGIGSGCACDFRLRGRREGCCCEVVEEPVRAARSDC
jgi:hypothetical protein